MLRKKFAGLLCLACLSMAAAAQEATPQAPDPAKDALIEEMMSLTHQDRMMVQFLQQYKEAFSKGMEESLRSQLKKNNQDPAQYETAMHNFEDQMFNLVADRMSWDKLKPKFIAIYEETFSKQEQADIVAFYKTPSGQSLLQKTPGLMAKGSQVGQAQMSSALGEIQRISATFIEDVQKAQKQTPKNDKN
jgi:hypothetical protein